MTGRFLNEKIGVVHWAFMVVGANMAFFPMHLEGLQGMPRRIAHYVELARIRPGITRLNQISTIGAWILGVGMLIFLVNVFLSFRKPRTAVPDPWEGNSLEWATTSPPPAWNFDALPAIRSERPVFDARHPEAAAQHELQFGKRHHAEEHELAADRPEREASAERQRDLREEADRVRREEERP
jgi:cytochrome c oxidase subunit 1